MTDKIHSAVVVFEEDHREDDLASTFRKEANDG